MLIGIIRRKRIINSNFITPLANDFFQSQGLSEAEEDRGDRSQKRKLQTDLLSCFQAPAVDTTERSHWIQALSQWECSLNWTPLPGLDALREWELTWKLSRSEVGQAKRQHNIGGERVVYVIKDVERAASHSPKIHQGRFITIARDRLSLGGVNDINRLRGRRKALITGIDFAFFRCFFRRGRCSL